MHKEIRETDVQWLAIGSWRHYFKHRDLSCAVSQLTAAMITIVIGAALVFIGLFSVPTEVDTPVPSHVIAMLAIGAVLVIIAIILYIMAAITERREEDRFVDYILDEWEDGGMHIPDSETVAEYLKNRELAR
ncbi:hypothetical protein [Candidatus Magnetobacterium casense]|uniref:Uncharacterized protein n=1 Tax=Candidatus Magnetobacterium casense TaxID=1455061 RepID=A0ABS6S3N5_9BACT|nr:hypothetical protein [Candidatus Magnetobacterium casensis]MBV6343023.1 hypothetical protein [Candidatus Magnetobacterium casensis]